MPGLIVTIGGRVDSTYEASLARSVAMSKVAAANIQREYAKAQVMISGGSSQFFNPMFNGRAATSTILNKNQVKTEAEQYGDFWVQELQKQEEKKTQADIAAASRRLEVGRRWRLRAEKRRAREENADVQGPDLSGELRASAKEEKLKDEIAAASRRLEIGRRLRARAERRAAAVAATAEQAAALKAEQLASLSIIARQGGIGAASGSAHGHKYGGRGGIISEIAVIGHELMQGRGGGRVLGSISILAQRMGFLGTIVKSTAAEEIKMAFTENALAGSMARTAIAAERAGKADAARLREMAVAQSAKAAAAVENAEMAAATATVSLGPLGWILAAVVALVSVFAVFAIAMHKTAMETRSWYETLATSTTAVSDHAEALDRATEAALDFEKAMYRLNQAHDISVQMSENAIDALNREAAAAAALADKKKQSALLDVDIREKTGKIGHVQALRERAKIEKQAVADKAAAEIAASKAVLDKKASDAIDANKKAEQAQVTAREADKAANSSPEAIKRREAFDFAKRKKDAADEAVKAAEKELERIRTSSNPIGKDVADAQADVDISVQRAKERTRDFNEAQNAMTPSELAASAASTKAQEAQNASKSLQESFVKAKAEYDSKAKNSPAQVAAEQALIDKQEKLAELGNQPRPENLTAMQRLGAFTGQGSNPLVDLHKTTNQRLQEILTTEKAWHAYITRDQGRVVH